MIQERRDEILGLAAKYGARNVRVFGSVNRQRSLEDSDIDLLVDMEGGRSVSTWLGCGRTSKRCCGARWTC